MAGLLVLVLKFIFKTEESEESHHAINVYFIFHIIAIYNLF